MQIFSVVDRIGLRGDRESRDVPAGYHQVGLTLYTATFKKKNSADAAVRERMNVNYTKEYGLMFSALTFITQDRKVAEKLCRYTEKRIKVIALVLEYEEYSSKEMVETKECNLAGV